MKLHLLLEAEIEDKLEQLLKLQAYVGEYNVSCEVELIDDDLVALMHSGTRYVVDDKMLDALQSVEDAYDYAYYVIKGRFELGEPAIAANAFYSYWYARDVIKGRFELGERTIATNAYYSYEYACDVIKGRFELGEPKILKSEYAKNYKLLLRPKQ
jgi:hypothetical protein